LRVDLKDSAANRGADRQLCDRGLDLKQFRARDIELTFRLARQWSAEIDFKPTKISFLLLQTILRAREPSARCVDVRIRPFLTPLCGCRLIKSRPRLNDGLFALGDRVLCLAAAGSSARRALVIPRTLAQRDLCLRGEQPRLGFIVVETHQWLSSEHLVIDL